MKLSELLFSEQTRTNFFAAPYGLLKDDTRLVLWDTRVTPQDKDLGEFICAFLSVQDLKNNCPAALAVKQVAANPKYPGAGEAIYQIAASVFGKPLTSDRFVSTSTSAQKAWDKVAKNPAFKRTELDNWLWSTDYETKIYVHGINKDTGEYTATTEPKTETEDDDCILPGDSVKSETDIAGNIKILGTPDAFKSSVNVSELVRNSDEAVKAGRASTDRLVASAKYLFTMRYT